MWKESSKRRESWMLAPTSVLRKHVCRDAIHAVKRNGKIVSTVMPFAHGAFDL